MLSKSPAYLRSQEQEESLASDFGGRTTIASGSKHEKGDFRVKKLIRGEAKNTGRSNFVVTRKMIESLELESFGHGEVPVIIARLNGTKEYPQDKEIAALPVWALQELVREIQEYRELTQEIY
jgi:hypothetical protein